jgi:hypothetical protein
MMRRAVDYLATTALVIAGWLWCDAAFAQVVSGTATGTGYPAGSTPLEAGAAGTTAGETATLAASPGQFTFLCGFSYSAGSATTAITTTVTTAGLASNFTLSVGAPATAVGVTGNTVVHPISPCVRASAVNTAVTVSGSALGTAGVNQYVNAWGYSVPQN